MPFDVGRGGIAGRRSSVEILNSQSKQSGGHPSPPGAPASTPVVSGHAEPSRIEVDASPDARDVDLDRRVADELFGCCASTHGVLPSRSRGLTKSSPRRQQTSSALLRTCRRTPRMIAQISKRGFASFVGPAATSTNLDFVENLVQ